MKTILRYFSPLEWTLWLGSYAIILLCFFLFPGGEVLSLISSLIGIASLIFSAKGNPVGPLLMILFAIAYGIISFSFAYYGEMITYLGMSLPMSVWAFVSWFKNPHGKGHAQVKVGGIRGREWGLLALLTLLVTVGFYFILGALDTANLIPSTISVATSFAAAYLTARRSPYYALAYAANDLVLIVLWILASLKDTGYISVIVCFAVFFIDDMYGFFNWRHMAKKQKM